ncbi:MAG: D-inositol-3-phosphate glycosyltransferase [Candidatus Methanoperedenaceae archaeon GB50]|nr:MAG: D-inositol-3-phosphate glycosyltransferase [Candidatus Methanoperedenaceae archaeon GB50]
MHICYCYHVFYPIKGGVEENIINISQELMKRGHEVTVVTSDIPDRPKKEIIHGIKVMRTKPLFSIFKTPIMPNYKELLSTVDADIIHAHGTIPNVSDVAIFYAAKNNIPSVLTYHFDGNADSIIGSFFGEFYNRFINRKVVSKADKIIATSKSYAETSMVLNDFLGKIEIIPNGVDLNRFNPEIEVGNIREKYNLPNGNIVLYVGRFVKYKGVEYLIRAMKYVEHGTLVIAGKGKLERRLKQIVRDEKLKNVKFLGYVPDEDLPKLYRVSDVYVLPSITRGENFGISALEAMACGIPVIASDLPGVNWLVRDYCGMKVKPKDVLGLSEKINELLSNDALRSEIGKNARKNAEEYNWEDISKKVMDVYEEVLSSR